MPPSLYAQLFALFESYEGEAFPFQIGDTHFAPPAAACLRSVPWRGAPTKDLYRYGKPAGARDLVDALVDKLSTKNELPTTPENVQITAGATHALSSAARILLDAGDEVLLLTPCWPLIRGHVLAVGARPVEVPFSSLLFEEPELDPHTLIERYVNPRTAAIYLITPNNPDGRVVAHETLGAIADVARRHDLWVLADEVYEDYVYGDVPHLSIATLPGMAERTLTVFSFSKSYGMAGLRLGYVHGPRHVMAPLSRPGEPFHLQRPPGPSVHGPGRPAKRRRISRRRPPRDYQEARDETLAHLRVPHIVPEAGSYVFMNLSTYLHDGETTRDLLVDLAKNGVLLAPGGAFGRGFETWARLCYSAVPTDRLAIGIERTMSVLASRRR